MRGIAQDHYVFTQPGMRYSIAKALVHSLMQDAYFHTVPERDRAYIVEKILDDVKGRMLEDIVLLETVKTLPPSKKAFQYRFAEGGEFDMVVYNGVTNTCSLFEVKHSGKAAAEQASHLNDPEKCAAFERIYGQIKGKYVLYRGETRKEGVIDYVNVEEYLTNL